MMRQPSLKLMSASPCKPERSPHAKPATWSISSSTRCIWFEERPMSYIRPAFVLLVLFSILLGLGYPAAITGIAQAAFSHQANGSLIERNGHVIGSELLAQGFSKPEYFW